MEFPTRWQAHISVGKTDVSTSSSLSLTNNHPLLYISFYILIPQASPKGGQVLKWQGSFPRRRWGSQQEEEAFILSWRLARTVDYSGVPPPSINPLGEMGMGGNPPPLPYAKLCSQLSFSLLNCILFFKDIRIKFMFLFPSIIVFSKKP